MLLREICARLREVDEPNEWLKNRITQPFTWLRYFTCVYHVGGLLANFAVNAIIGLQNVSLASVCQIGAQCKDTFNYVLFLLRYFNCVNSSILLILSAL